MVFYDEAEARKLYERYKLQWMVYHGLGLVDLMDCMEAMIQEDLTSSETRSKLQELFKAWELTCLKRMLPSAQNAGKNFLWQRKHPLRHTKPTVSTMQNPASKRRPILPMCF